MYIMLKAIVYVYYGIFLAVIIPPAKGCLRGVYCFQPVRDFVIIF